MLILHSMKTSRASQFGWNKSVRFAPISLQDKNTEIFDVGDASDTPKGEKCIKTFADPIIDFAFPSRGKEHESVDVFSLDYQWGMSDSCCCQCNSA